MSRKTNGTSEKNGRIEKTITKPADGVPFQPVYFLSLEVENFRCFGPRQMLSLSTENRRPAQWTVILGENGVGKTTLLRLLADFEPVEHKSISSDESHIVPKFFTEFSGFNWFGYSVDMIKFGEKGSQLAVKYYVGDLINSHTVRGSILELSVNILGPSMRSDIGEVELKHMVCFGYGASRRTGKSNLSGKQTNDDCASLFDDDAELLNAEEWLLQADYAARRDSPHQKQAVEQRERVTKVLIDLLPDVEDVRIVEEEGTRTAPKVEFRTPYGWVRLQSLSLGYRALITWMVDLASRLFDRYPDSPDPLAEPAVVLVDEIDLHLHPRWQRTLMQFLSDIFKQTQFIVTAHSPLVVQAADENANIVLLRREGDHVVIENDVKTIRGWRVDQILTSDLFGLETARPPQWDDAIKERNAILSKGKLTKKDEARLAELEKQMDELPTGETPSDMEAMDIIRRAAELLKTK